MFGMAVTIGLLCVCKYTLFITENVNILLSTLHIPRISTFRMILPLGISFYSFMALSYKVPEYIVQIKSIPRSFNGKLLRKELEKL